MISPKTIASIRDRVEIVPVISESVKLTRKGRSMLGLCPFHKEKTPSFHVNAERGRGGGVVRRRDAQGAARRAGGAQGAKRLLLLSPPHSHVSRGARRSLRFLLLSSVLSGGPAISMKLFIRM